MTTAQKAQQRLRREELGNDIDNAQQSYEAAIERQDRAFVGACVDGIGGIPWTETIRLTECVDAFRTVGLRSLKG